MELKVSDKNSLYYNVSAPKQNNSDNRSFSKTLNDVNKSYINIKKNIENGIKVNITTIDNLPREKRGDTFDGIDKSDKIWGIDILGDTDQFMRKDCTINMIRILSEYGANATSFAADDLTKTINKLYDFGLITTEDYFYTLKWIATQKEASRIKMNNEKIAGTLVDLHNNINKNKII